MSRADPPSPLCRPHGRKLVDQQLCGRHPALDRAIADALHCTDLGSHGAKRVVASVGVIALLGDVYRQSSGDGQQPVACGAHAAQRRLRDLQRTDEIGERRHLRVRRVEQCCHVISRSETTDIRR
jgi:hypothetical protein